METLLIFFVLIVGGTLLLRGADNGGNHMNPEGSTGCAFEWMLAIVVLAILALLAVGAITPDGIVDGFTKGPAFMR